MQSIRDWMEANPDQAKDIRRMNKSYVFFRITDLSTEDEAVGGEGVQLVPGRSIAIDRALHAYGTPFFITANLPIANEKPVTKFDRLMVAQDTGSAIVGPARADIYFGAGDEAARIAGRIKNPGDFVHAVAARARSGRGRARYAAAARAAEFVHLQCRHDGRSHCSRSGGRRRDRCGGARAQTRAGAENESKTPAEKMSRRRVLERRRTSAVGRYVRSITPLPRAKLKPKPKTEPQPEPTAPAARVVKTPRGIPAPHADADAADKVASVSAVRPAHRSSAWRAAATPSMPASICTA